jgi:hypothetical protein
MRSATVPATEPNKTLKIMCVIRIAAMDFALPVVCRIQRLSAIPLKQSPNTDIAFPDNIHMKVRLRVNGLEAPLPVSGNKTLPAPGFGTIPLSISPPPLTFVGAGR